MGTPTPMDVLPDLVPPKPRVVFCGLANTCSPGRREHRYDGPGNSFWDHLHRSGLSPRLLAPHEEEQVLDLGLGLSDLVRRGDPLEWDVEDLVERVERWRPEWLAFTGKTNAAIVARALGERRPSLGPTDWYVGPAQVFVLPGPSGANHRRDYDGRPDRLSWWHTLAELL